MPEKFGRLSQELEGARHPTVCQSCGQGDLMPRLEDLQRWQEHDDRDKPERILVILCESCAKALIKPHPRLYRFIDRLEPWPGAITELCSNCIWRKDLDCTHAALKSNGGPGLMIAYPKPTTMHLNYGGGRGEFRNMYSGPPTRCAGQKVNDDNV